MKLIECSNQEVKCIGKETSFLTDAICVKGPFITIIDYNRNILTNSYLKIKPTRYYIENCKVLKGPSHLLIIRSLKSFV